MKVYDVAFDKENFLRSLWISAGLHFTLIITMLLAGVIFRNSRKLIDLDAPVIWTDVRLAKANLNRPPPRTFFPPIPTSPDAGAPSEVLRTREDLTKKEIEEERVEDEKRRAAMQAALSNITREVAPRRLPVAGETPDPTSLGGVTAAQIFKNQIKQKIINNLHVTDYDWFGVYRERVVEYLVRLNDQGEVIDITLTRASGVASIDQAVRLAIQRSEPFYAPTPDLREYFAAQGIAVKFSPKDVEQR